MSQSIGTCRSRRMPTEIGREWDGWRKSANSFMAKTAKVIKWPIGILVFAMIPAAIMSILDIVSSISGNWIEFASLVGGIGLYALIRYTFLGEKSWIRTLEVLHHELIHAALAIVCFCTIEEIKATRSSGGHVKYHGEGNWIITLGPYFLPLIPLFIACTSIFIEEPFSYVAIALTGFSMGFYYVSLRDDLQIHQTDLKKVGLPFILVFIIPANIITIYLVTLISINGGDGFTIWADSILTNSYDFITDQF